MKRNAQAQHISYYDITKCQQLLQNHGDNSVLRLIRAINEAPAQPGLLSRSNQTDESDAGPHLTE